MNKLLSGAPDGLRERALANPPHWAHDILVARSRNAADIESLFVSRSSTSTNGSINVFAVRGTAHPDYGGNSWLHLLEHGKRMRANLDLYASNPAYYLDPAVKSAQPDYFSFDGHDWYIGADGNHRTAIARFAFAERGQQALMHGVSTCLLTIDRPYVQSYRETTDLVQKLALNWRLEPKLHQGPRADAGMWSSDEYSTSIEIHVAGYTTSVEREDFFELADQLAAIRLKPWLVRAYLVRNLAEKNLRLGRQ